MTIKTRNKLNLGLFIFSLLSVAFNTFIFLFSLSRGTFSLDLYLNQVTKSNFLTEYNPFFVLISLYFQIVYVCITSFMLFRVFEKTQASDIAFLFLFLIACIANSFRIWIPLFQLGNTYSKLLLFCGNQILFSKLLVPISIFFCVTMGKIEQRQDLEKYLFLSLLICIIFAKIIPLNTTTVSLNFEVDYSYRNIIKAYTIITLALSIFTLFMDNKRRMYTQITTIGLSFICIGIYILFNATNLLRLILAFLLLLIGNILFLKELHKQYLWYD